MAIHNMKFQILVNRAMSRFIIPTTGRANGIWVLVPLLIRSMDRQEAGT